MVLRADEVILRDCDSTNGTYLGGLLIREATLSAGQTFRAGDVEFLVESTEVKVAIPEVELPVEAPPVMLADGSMLCRRHPEAKVTHRCGHCHEVLCDQCVTRLRRRGGKVLKLCAVCSQPVDPITPEKKKKRSLLGILRKTVKLPFVRSQKVQQ